MSKIESICNQIRTEARSIIATSQEIENLLKSGEGKSADLLDEIRIDGVTHLQKLTLALSRCFYEEEALNAEVASGKTEEV